MPSGLDHVADANGAELCRFAKLYAFPEFVKSADLDQVFKPGELNVTVYADPVRREFPCHNAASTWLSALYFTEKRAELHPKEQARIQERLDRYVRYWRIEAPVNSMLTKHASYVKDAESQLPDSAYGLVWVDQQSGRKMRHLRMLNAREVKAAADYLFQYRDRFSFKDRHAIATKVLEKAARFGAAVGERLEFLEKQAGRGVCNPDEVIQMLQDRARLANLPALKSQLLKLAALVRNDTRASLQPDNLVKLAETVDVVDRGLGLVGKYSDGVPRPEDVIFSATFSKTSAEVTAHVALTSGKVYKKADFSKVQLGDVRSLFGNAFADEVQGGLDRVDPEKLAELAATLPRGDAELFDSLMAECKLQPRLLKSASVRQGLTPADLKRLEEAY